MEEFLRNRTFKVKLGAHLSGEGNVKSGVPQWSVLGDLLFLTLISDLADELICYHLFFADNIKLIASKKGNAS